MATCERPPLRLAKVSGLLVAKEFRTSALPQKSYDHPSGVGGKEESQRNANCIRQEGDHILHT